MVHSKTEDDILHRMQLTNLYLIKCLRTKRTYVLTTVYLTLRAELWGVILYLHPWIRLSFLCWWCVYSGSIVHHATYREPLGRPNIKMSSDQKRNSLHEEETISRPYHVYNGNPNTNKKDRFYIETPYFNSFFTDKMDPFALPRQY